MLQVGDEVMYFSVVFVAVMLVTRSATGASLLTAFLYVFMVMFRFPPVPADQAGRVLRPRAPPGGVPVVAHRGGSHDAPENTLAAIREAGRNGAAGVELDLSFTADGVPVLMHDETVDRTTNGSGPVSKLLLVQLRRLDAAARHRLKDKFSGEKVPTLQEAVEESIRQQLTVFFNVKAQPDKAAAVLHEMYQKFPVLYNSSIVCSFEPKVIYKSLLARTSSSGPAHLCPLLVLRCVRPTPPWSRLSPTGPGGSAGLVTALLGRCQRGASCGPASWTSCWTGPTITSCGNSVESLLFWCRKTSSHRTTWGSGQSEVWRWWAGA
ncbi:glycerophosphodiester phosphodiesterase 1-like isoform X2 [Acanthochromis polyacanthus]|uniref:glycerophosphodiester phosphodiesterase 1-like isoform X2 n=1 Tax=Acanthochromis polyacanthus TaxID=80966 RepID=UPI00223494C0|nr:glycerophosphodiester phosphodiesterase 1-like isoform X2 [Acanthochromis polyacanthus]